MALHAVILSLQFGAPGTGSPWFGLPWNERRASAPPIKAILRQMASPSVPNPPGHSKTSSESSPRDGGIALLPTRRVESAGDRNPMEARPAAPTLSNARVIGSAAASPSKVVMVTTENAVVAVQSNPSTTATISGADVLSTNMESAWSIPAAKESLPEEKTGSDQSATKGQANNVAVSVPAKSTDLDEIAAHVKASEASEEAVEKKRLEDLAQIENEKRMVELEALAQARQEAMEKKRLEELAQIENAKRIAELAALTQARQEAMERNRLEELARIENAKMIAEQTTLAQAKNETAERVPTDQPGKAAVKHYEPMESLSKKPGDISTAREQAGIGEHGLPQQSNSGREMATSALEQARVQRFGGSGNEPLESRQRRGSIFGRESKDIQLAFYGESWRQKVERIGRVNYPKLSKNRTYDSLVTTVSINSDGTLNSVRIERSSGDKNLDEAVRRIVEMSAPFAAFPPALKSSYDVVDITRSWTFLEEQPRINSQ
jgi:protein TonB